METSTGHIIGHKYYCKYWKTTYVVLGTEGDRVLVRWEDGTETTHATNIGTDKDITLSE